MQRQIKRILSREQAKAVANTALRAYDREFDKHELLRGFRGSRVLPDLTKLLAFTFVIAHGAPVGLDAITVAGELAEALRERYEKDVSRIDYLETLLLNHAENV